MPRKKSTDITLKTPPSGQIVHKGEFDQFAQWMAIPKRLREPATHGEMAKHLGVHIDTLADWKKRDDFWERVKGYRKAFLRETIPDILDAAIQAAKRDSFNDRKLLLEMMEEYLPTTRSELTGKDGKPIELGIVGIIREAAQQQLPEGEPNNDQTNRD